MNIGELASYFMLIARTRKREFTLPIFICVYLHYNILFNESGQNIDTDQLSEEAGQCEVQCGYRTWPHSAQVHIIWSHTLVSVVSLH